MSWWAPKEEARLLAPCSGGCGKVVGISFGTKEKALLRDLVAREWLLSAVTIDEQTGVAPLCFPCAVEVHGQALVDEAKRILTDAK